MLAVSAESGSLGLIDDPSETEFADQQVRAPRVPATVGQGPRTEVYRPTVEDGWDSFVVAGTQQVMSIIARLPELQRQIERKQLQRAISRYLVPVRLSDYIYRATKFYQDLLPPAPGPRPLLVGGVTQSRKTVMIAVSLRQTLSWLCHRSSALAALYTTGRTTFLTMCLNELCDCCHKIGNKHS